MPQNLPGIRKSTSTGTQLMTPSHDSTDAKVVNSLICIGVVLDRMKWTIDLLNKLKFQLEYPNGELHGIDWWSASWLLWRVVLSWPNTRIEDRKMDENSYTCPECRSTFTELDHGYIPPHSRSGFVFGRNGFRSSSVLCDGSGQKPVDTSTKN